MKKFSLLVLVILIVISGYWFYQKQNAQSAAAAPPQGQAPRAVNVSTLVLQPQDINREVTVPGRIATVRQAEVRPQVSGILLQRLFEEGSKVQAGQVLYVLDDTRYQAALDKAEADLASAKTNISLIESKTQRYEKLVQNGAVSQQGYEDAKIELEQAYANIEVAKAQLRIAKVNLEYTRVRAPISGTIGRTLVSEGALVTENQSQAMAEITQLDPIYADLQITLEDKRRLDQFVAGSEQQADVVLQLPSLNSQYAQTGKLKFSEVLLNTSTDSLTLRAEFNNPNSELIPGQFVEAKILAPRSLEILIPQRATTRTPQGELSVWLNNNGKAEPKQISVGSAYKDQWIVTQGLNEGDEVVISGYQKLRPGAALAAKPWSVEGQGGQ